MNNSIEKICLSLSEKGQVIKNNVARSIEDMHQQEDTQQPVSPAQKQSNSKAKTLIFGGLVCLAAGVFLGITAQQQSAKQESEGNRTEQNNDKSQKQNNHGTLGTASVIMDIIGVVGICLGTFLSHKRRGNRSNVSPIKEVDFSRYSSDLIEAICSIKEKCSEEWDAAVMEHTNRCKQVIDTMKCSEDEKIKKKEFITTSSLIKYNSFEIQQLIDSASSTYKISAINDAVEVCSKKLQDAIDSAISQQISIYKNVMV